MPKKQPLTDQEVEVFLDELSAVVERGSKLGERLFETLSAGVERPVQHLRSLTQTQERLAYLAAMLSAKAANLEDARALRETLQAQVKEGASGG